MSKIDLTKKIRKFKPEYGQKQLRTIKLIAEVVKTIVRNNNKILSNKDIEQICLKVYGKHTRLIHVRVRNYLKQEITQNNINSALIEFYSNAGLNKEEAINLLNLAKETAKEKKDVTNLLKIVEKYENAANLTQKSTFTARTTETIDYSKIGEPTKKVTKTLEITKNEAISGDMSNDLDKVNDNVQPEKE